MKKSCSDKMTLPRTHSFQAPKATAFSTGPLFCPPSSSFPSSYLSPPYLFLPLSLSHPWKTYPCGLPSEFCTTCKAQLKCHLNQKSVPSSGVQCLSPLQLSSTHESALISCSSASIS